MINILTNVTLLNFAYKIIIPTLMLNFLVNKFSNNTSSISEKRISRKANPISFWMCIFHTLFIIILLYLYCKIELITIILNLCGLMIFFSIFVICFLQACIPTLKLQNRKLNYIETEIYLYISYFILLLFKEFPIIDLKQLLLSLYSNYFTIFQYIFIPLLLLKVFFICITIIYSCIILLKNFKIITKAVITKITFKINFKDNKLIQFLFSFNWYYYDFIIFTKYKQKHKHFKLLILFLDLIIAFIIDILVFFIYLLRLPIWTFTLILNLLFNYLLKLSNIDLSIFVFKWFRIIFIFSILVTYIIIKIYNLEIQPAILDIFELIATVILIPFIIEQISKSNKK